MCKHRFYTVRLQRHAPAHFRFQRKILNYPDGSTGAENRMVPRKQSNGGSIMRECPSGPHHLFEIPNFGELFVGAFFPIIFTESWSFAISGGFKLNKTTDWLPQYYLRLFIWQPPRKLPPQTSPSHDNLKKRLRGCDSGIVTTCNYHLFLSKHILIVKSNFSFHF